MGGYIDANESTRFSLAPIDEGLELTLQVAEAVLWGCLVCRSEGVRFRDRDETSPLHYWADDVAPHCGHVSGMAQVHWCFLGEGETLELCLKVWTNEGGSLRRKVCLQGYWPVGEHSERVEEAMHLFQDLLEASGKPQRVDDILASANCQPELPF